MIITSNVKQRNKYPTPSNSIPIANYKTAVVQTPPYYSLPRKELMKNTKACQKFPSSTMTSKPSNQEPKQPKEPTQK
jgi:hypothetical protein